MAVVNIKTYVDKNYGYIKQCDILKSIDYIEYVSEEGGVIEVSKIIFPYVIVLSQACDLEQDRNARIYNNDKSTNKQNTDKYLISVIVAPMYNFEEFRMGKHLSQLGMNMDEQGRIDRSKCKYVIQNENKRYHYLQFDENVDIVDSVIDFKHYFTININYLYANYKRHYVCSISDLYRELISQRFSNFLSRIGLPDASENI